MMRIFLTGLILMMAPVLHAGEQRPCSIMLKFGHDKFGPVALYVFQWRRAIAGQYRIVLHRFKWASWRREYW